MPKRCGGEGARRRRRRDTDQPYHRTNPRPASSGPTTARRACAAPAPLQQIAMQMPTNALGRGRSHSMLALFNPAMADAGIAVWESEVLLPVLRPVAGSVSPMQARHRCSGDGNSATVADPTFNAAGRAGEQSDRAQLYGRHSPAYPSGHADSAARCSKFCARSTRATTLPSHSYPTSFNGGRSTARGTSTADAAVVQVTSEAEERERPEPIYLESTGPSTRANGSPRGSGVATTYSTMRSGRCWRQSSKHRVPELGGKQDQESDVYFGDS